MHIKEILWAKKFILLPFTFFLNLKFSYLYQYAMLKSISRIKTLLCS